MKWCRVELDGRPIFGIVEGDDIALLDAAPYESHRRINRSISFSKAKFLPPVVPLNYAGALVWAAAIGAVCAPLALRAFRRRS